MGRYSHLLGTRAAASRAVKPYDHLTKAEMWKRIEDLERRMKRASTLAAGFARDAHHRQRVVWRDAFHEVEAALDLSRPLS